MQGRPESVSRPGEVVAGRSGVESRIDSAEQNSKLRRNEIGNGLARRSGKLGLAGARDVSRQVALDVQAECVYRLGPSRKRRSTGFEWE